MKIELDLTLQNSLDFWFLVETKVTLL